MAKVNFDDFADEYDELLRKEAGFFSTHDRYFAEYKARVAREVIGFEPSKILEFGCGTGRNIPFLKACFPSAEIHGSDVSSKSLELAAKLNPGTRFFLEDDALGIRSIYELIFVAGVLHHIAPNLRNNVLRGVKGRLAPHGQSIIFEHNPYNPVTRRIVSGCPFDADAVLLTARELTQRLTVCGFQVRKRGYTLFFPERLGALARADRFLRWLPLGGQYFILASA